MDENDVFYKGTIKFDKRLDDDTYNLLTALNATRRMWWDAAMLEADGIAKVKEIGNDGEFFFDEREFSYEEFNDIEKRYATNRNLPPGVQPDLYDCWEVTPNRKGLVWDNSEGSYYGHEWLQYLVKKILVPRGYHPSGIVNYFIPMDFQNQNWHTVVDGNTVRKYKGFSRKQKKPDIVVRYESDEYWEDRCLQAWLKHLCDKKVEFLGERGPTKELKAISEFHVYLNGNIYYVVSDIDKIYIADYRYKNIKLVDEEIVAKCKWASAPILIRGKLKKVIENAIVETPDYQKTLKYQYQP